MITFLVLRFFIKDRTLLEISTILSGCPNCWKRVHALYGIQPRCRPWCRKGSVSSTLLPMISDPDRGRHWLRSYKYLCRRHPTIGWKFLRQIKKRCFCSKRTSEPEIPSYLSFRCPFIFRMYSYSCTCTPRGPTWVANTTWVLVLPNFWSWPRKPSSCIVLSKATFMITEYSPVTLLHSKMFGIPSA